MTVAAADQSELTLSIQTPHHFAQAPLDATLVKIFYRRNVQKDGINRPGSVVKPQLTLFPTPSHCKIPLLISCANLFRQYFHKRQNCEPASTKTGNKPQTVLVFKIRQQIPQNTPRNIRSISQSADPQPVAGRADLSSVKTGNTEFYDWS